MVCVLAAVALGWLVGGTPLAVAGVVAGLALSWWTGRLETPSMTRAKAEIARDLPLAADLLAACATAGRPVDDALRVVSRAVGGALGDRLDAIVARLSLGADPLTEWRRTADDPQLATLGRTMARTIESGAPLVESLTRLAEDRRRERRTQTQLRARNVGVKAAGPLAACFLPAFMLIGVIPTIAGGFRNLVM
jgi:Flp pilus assembly protein TadB